MKPMDCRMPLDIFRLNALVRHLLEPGETFDPDAARELYEALPDETIPLFQVTASSKSGGTFEGLTNAGSGSLDEEKKFSIGTSYGTWVGSWRVTREGQAVHIELRFDEEAVRDRYKLVFRKDSVKLLKSRYYHFPLSSSTRIVFCRMKPWKSPRKPKEEGALGD